SHLPGLRSLPGRAAHFLRSQPFGNGVARCVRLRSLLKDENASSPETAKLSIVPLDRTRSRLQIPTECKDKLRRPGSSDSPCLIEHFGALSPVAEPSPSLSP